MTIDLRSRFAGSMLGTFCGDALGMPVENWSGDRIRRIFGVLDEMRPAALWLQVYGKTYGLIKDPVHGMSGPRLTSGVYTDDTQMMIGVAESLVERRGFDPADMALRFANNYDPRRGYGPGTMKVLSRIRRGAPWDRPAGEMFGGTGSYGNGAAMRVAPVGLLFHRDPDELRRVAEISARITHTHPIGREGAVLMAFAVACALSVTPGTLVSPAFCSELIRFTRADCDELVRKLRLVEQLLSECAEGRVPGSDEVAATLGNDVSAAGSVPAALYSVLAHPTSLRDAVVFAVNLGGDSDTLGAMAGAFAGALHGEDAIPTSWLDALENDSKGREHVTKLAERLHELAMTQDFCNAQ